ncbi:prolyl endopeptidase-like protein [Tanacetum coccineum]|uniref:Prolyl endopeptidase-like protein n=1 Tax=Tanacetum coccineum TaxID=301880 RepID=A0ABQ5H8M6_9ASTR
MELKERIEQAKEKSDKDGMFTSECEFRDEMLAIRRYFVTIHGEMVLPKNYNSLNFAGGTDHLSVHPWFLYKGSCYYTTKVDGFDLIESLQNGRLEDPESEEVKEFVKKQVELTEFVLKKCEMRERLHDKLIKSYEYPNFGASFREAEKYFYFHNSRLQPQKVMYMQLREGLDKGFSTVKDLLDY